MIKRATVISEMKRRHKNGDVSGEKKSFNLDDGDFVA